MPGTLTQLSISNGGIPKLAIDRAMVSTEGVVGDWQKNRKYHGGPDRAVCIFSEEFYESLAADGVKISRGAVGENFTTRGIDLTSLSAGSKLRVGKCLIEITDIRVPCVSLKKWDARFPKLLQGRNGWLAKVLEPAEVKQGDSIEVVE